MHLNLPGNFGLTSGALINLKMPLRSVKVAKDDGSDDYLSGKYIVTATRQIIKSDMHETVIELATDSTNRPLVKKQTSNMQNASKS
jgi:hypothetical protein